MSDESQPGQEMSSSRPYMIRAIHEWISDNGMTPYIVVDATDSMVTVPLAHVDDGKIVLNSSYSATSGLSIENDWISFSARFSGASEHISFPPGAVRAIYAQENGQGMIFPETVEGKPDEADAAAESDSSPEISDKMPSGKRPPKKSAPILKIVK